METKSSQDEIDLIEGLNKLLAIILGNKIKITVCLIAGASLGYAYYNQIEPKWYSRLMLSTLLLTGEEGDFIANTGLSNIPVDIVSQSKVDKSEVLYLTINVTVDHPETLPDLEHDIVTYFSQSAPLKRRKQQKEVYYDLMIKELDHEMELISNTINKLENGKQTTYYNPSDLYAKRVEFLNTKIGYQRLLEEIRNNPVQVVKGFSRPVSNEMPLYTAILVGLGLGSFIAIFLIFASFLASSYKQFVKTKN